MSEVRKRQVKSNVTAVEDFQEKAAVYQSQHPEQIVLTGFLSSGGFIEKARQLGEQFEVDHSPPSGAK